MKQLVLIGGSAGAGKSTVAKPLANALGAGWLQIDTLWIALQEALAPDTDAYNRLRIDKRVVESDDSTELLVAAHIEASQAICAVLPRALEFDLRNHSTVVADGAWLLPEFMANLRLDGVTVRAAILHEADPADVRAAMDSRRAVNVVAPWHERSALASWAYGNWLAEEARRVGIPVVAAQPRESLVARLRAALDV